MRKLLGPYADFFFFLLRVVAALMFLAHGLQKFNVQMLGGFVPPANLPQLTWAAWIETIGAPLIILGIGTRYVAFVLAGEMAVAYFTQHAPRGVWYWPILNGGDLAVLFSFLWLFFCAAGPGPISLDGLRGRAK